MKRILAVAVLAGLLSGCAANIPFQQPASVEIGRADPAGVVEEFRKALPDDFHLLSSIVFEYNWISVAGIGYLDVNAPDRRLKVACMNDLGVKIFEFEADRNGLVRQYAIEPLARQGNIAAIVAEDIRRIYLDRTPESGARAVKEKDALVFRQRSGDGVLEYRFAGEGHELVSKTYREDNRAVWRVSYYEYLRKNGKLYPMGIILTNFRYGYRLIVRQKEIRD